MNKSKMSDFGNEWETLRKQARSLENDIDLKLVSFSKLGSNMRGGQEPGNSLAYRNPHSDQSKWNMSSMSESMSIEIEHLLAELTKINDRMSEYSQSLNLSSQNTTLLHMLQRHRDILQDYSHEFHRTKSNILAVKEREQLLGSIYKDNNSFKPTSQTDLYLKEQQHLLSSERMVDEQINIALNTKENLQFQKSALFHVTSQLNKISNKFPVLNNLIMKINMRKKRDSLVLGLVIGVCLVFTFYFIIR